MTRYRKISTIEAVQFLGVTPPAGAQFAGAAPRWILDLMTRSQDKPGAIWTVAGGLLAIRTLPLGGIHFASPGDWVARTMFEAIEDVWPITGDVFERTYEPVEEPAG